MIHNDKQTHFSAIPDDLLIAAENIRDKALRETLGDILRQLAKENKAVNGEWHFYDECFYPMTWASKRLGKDEHTISRRLSKLVEKNILTVTKEKKGYKVDGDKYFRPTTYIKLKPVSVWGTKEQ